MGRNEVQLTADDHLRCFIEFCERKLGVNGPDVHMKTAGVGTADVTDLEERLWRLGVYNSFCSTPPAAAVWARWSRDRVLKEGQAALAAWLRKHWAGIPVRKNRRPARSPDKLARCLHSLATYLAAQGSGQFFGEATYEEAWDSLDAVYTWGRYVKIKFLETLRRYMGFEQLDAPDIRAAGGWSPRRALAYMEPEKADILLGKSSSRETLQLVHAIAADVCTEVYAVLRRQVSFYELEALLCNYRQTCSGTFYAGRTIDSELEYHAKVECYFGADPYLGTFDFFGTRRRVFPPECLGELSGWSGVRKDLWSVFREHQVIWSDVVYDYRATTNLARPVRRDGR